MRRIVILLLACAFLLGAVGCGSFAPNRQHEKCPFEPDLVKTISVDASPRWQPTGVFVHPKDDILIHAEGTWGMRLEAGPDGNWGANAVLGFGFVLMWFQPVPRFGEWRWNELVGKIGDKSGFLVGSEKRLLVADNGAGELLMAFNNIMSGHGTMHVTVYQRFHDRSRAATVPAEYRPKRSASATLPATSPTFGQRPPSPAPPAIRNVHVLIIGVGAYEDASISALPYSQHDAQRVLDFFANSKLSLARPENVHLLTDRANEDDLKADKAGMLTAVRKYLIDKAGPEDMVIFYFSGHGDAGKSTEENVAYYLVPMDARKDNLQDTAIDLDTFQARWNEIKAGVKVCIVDSCNSGGFVAMKDLSIRGVDRMADAGTTVLAASAPGEKALGWPEKGHSLFTQVLLDGLSGKADLPVGYGDGKLTLREIKLWLEQSVPAKAKELGAKQTPMITVPEGWDGIYITR